MSANVERAWWKEAIVYQIYPISFFDSNGDGIGDLNGIHAKLDYLKDLGVDMLWLSPIYRSPLADMGYDISDYRDIDPRYGTLQDWDNLIKGVHDRGMKLMMDLVVNHTSDEHEWFNESRSSKDNPKRDWYIWRPPRFDAEGNRKPPNNWRSVFQGSAWDWDEKTQEYYLHLYVSKQPDLNWDNPEVRNAVWDLMRFWLDRGCDGFRMDVINLISKVSGLPDAAILEPGQEYQLDPAFWANGPHVHEYLKEMHEKVLSKYDIMTVGETPFTHDAEVLAAYVLPKNKELQMIFQFEIMDLDSPLGDNHSPLIHRDWKLSELKSIISRWAKLRRDDSFWNATFIENHDHSRAVSRFGNDSDEWRSLSAKMLATMEVTLNGTQYIYQGQELGLKNFPQSWGIEEYKDVASQNYWNRVRNQRKQAGDGGEVNMSDVLDGFARKARDHSRVPMQWDTSPHAGFTSGNPWMRVNEDYQTWNASLEAEDKDSVLNFYKKAIKTRKSHDVLVYGNLIDISPGDEQVFAYTRSIDEKSPVALVLLNFKPETADFNLGASQDWDKFELILGNYPNQASKGVLESSVSLKGYESRVYIRF